MNKNQFSRNLVDLDGVLDNLQTWIGDCWYCRQLNKQVYNNCSGPYGAHRFENVGTFQHMNENPEERFPTNSGEFSRHGCQQKFLEQGWIINKRLHCTCLKKIK